MLPNLTFVFFLLFNQLYFAAAQDSLSFDFAYDVNRVHPSLSLSKAEAIVAESIADLNKYYKPSWIKEYISVELRASIKGKEKIAFGDTENLNAEQKKLLLSADANTDIHVNVRYLPENSLSIKEVKEIDFSFSIDPETEAHFVNGQDKLKAYLHEKAFQYLSINNFAIYQLTVVTFSITEDGKVVDVELMEHSQDKKVDELLLDAICNMPDWIPAQYSNGLKVKQDFALTAGDHTSCVINLINIRDKYPIK